MNNQSLLEDRPCVLSGLSEKWALWDFRVESHLLSPQEHGLLTCSSSKILGSFGHLHEQLQMIHNSSSSKEWLFLVFLCIVLLPFINPTRMGIQFILVYGIDRKKKSWKVQHPHGVSECVRTLSCQIFVRHPSIPVFGDGQVSKITCLQFGWRIVVWMDVFPPLVPKIGPNIYPALTGLLMKGVIKVVELIHLSVKDATSRQAWTVIGSKSMNWMVPSTILWKLPRNC